MRITTKRQRGVTIIQPRGNITIGDGDVALRDAVQGALDGGAEGVLIDFARVPRIDSSGLGELVAAHQRAAVAGCDLKLTNLRSRVADVVEVTQVHTVVDVFESEESAIASFVSP